MPLPQRMPQFMEDMFCQMYDARFFPRKPDFSMTSSGCQDAGDYKDELLNTMQMKLDKLFPEHAMNDSKIFDKLFTLDKNNVLQPTMLGKAISQALGIDMASLAKLKPGEFQVLEKSMKGLELTVEEKSELKNVFTKLMVSTLTLVNNSAVNKKEPEEIAEKAALLAEKLMNKMDGPALTPQLRADMMKSMLTEMLDMQFKFFMAKEQAPTVDIPVEITASEVGSFIDRGCPAEFALSKSFKYDPSQPDYSGVESEKLELAEMAGTLTSFMMEVLQENHGLQHNSSIPTPRPGH